MFEFKADAQEFYNKVAKPVVESVQEHPASRSSTTVDLFREPHERDVSRITDAPRGPEVQGVGIKGVNRSSATPGGAKLRGVSKYHNGKYVYYRAYIWVTRHTVNKQLIKTFKTLEEAVAQRQEWEQVKDILDGKVAMVLPFEWDMVYASKYWEVYHGMAQEQDEDYGM